MKNFFKSLLIVVLSIFFINTCVFADIVSVEDIDIEKSKIQDLNSVDFSSFYNTSAVIGTQRASVNMVISNYKSASNTIIKSLDSIIQQIEQIESSDEFSDSEKDMKKAQLIDSVNQELNKMPNNALAFLKQLEEYIPPFTHIKFSNNFIDYFNGLNINENQIEM